MALRQLGAKSRNLFLGVCLPSIKHDASKFKIQQFKLDEYYLYHYEDYTELYAHDPNKICKVGDIVLLQELQQKISKEIDYEVVEVIYPLGDIIDPITGKAVVKDKYRDEIEKIELAFGRPKNSFNYSEAPKRGWQEGKKDLSNRNVYAKYHDFEKGDKNEHQPYARPNVYNPLYRKIKI